MSAPLEDRRSSLAGYVPHSVVRHIASLQDVPTAAFAERTDGAILVVDITGFTPITASAVLQGRIGTEQLSRSFNAYIGQLIDLISEHGGDISKIVGDALIPVWEAGDAGVAAAARRAATCALAIRERAGEYEQGDLRLSVKIGLCAGELASLHVGGVDGRWLHLIAGPAVSELSSLEEHLVTGDVISTAGAWKLVSERFVGETLKSGNVRIRSTGQTLAPRPLPTVTLSPDNERFVRSYVPQVLLARLDAGQGEWLAELRQTTVVFANIRGAPEGSVDALPVLDGIATAAQRIANRYDAWLKELTVDDKGTTVSLVLGIPPYTHEDDASRAVSAALELESQINMLGLSTGVGVTTGPTFCGPVGNANRSDFAMLGAHVNLAARLMLAATDDRVLCDLATHDAARERHNFERLPAYVLKGLSDPTDVYVALPTVSIVGGAAQLVDRTAEMGTGASSLNAVRAGSGGLLLVEGEPGIGKSRIVAEWTREAERQGIAALVGQASEIELSTPYHAWRPVLERLFDLDGKERSARVATLQARLEGARADVELAPLLSGLFSLDLEDSELTTQMTGEVRADNTRDVLIALIRNSVLERPLVVVLEDAQWLDWASWQLVRQVRIELASVLLVLTTRPVAASDSDLNAILEQATGTVQLSPLVRADALKLAAQRSGATAVADAVATIVDERAEGNPLFIEQLTYSMRDAGQIVVDKGVLRGVRDDDLRRSLIPDSVQRVIVSRLDQLPPDQALTLKVASVIGTRFAVRTLREIHPLSPDPDRLATDLERLGQMGLVQPAASSPEPAYEFGHKITQEVAYNLMPQAQLRQLHGRVAEWYERSYVDDLSPFHALLAYHWRRAGEPSRAVDYLEMAGSEALRTFANEEAIGFLQDASDLDAEAGLAATPARRARWHIGLGEAFVQMSRYRSGREQLEIGLRLLGKGPPRARWRLTLSLVAQLFRQTLHRLGIHRPRALGSEERDELVTVCRAYERLAEAAYYDGDALLPLYSSIRILNEAETSRSAPEIARGLAGTGALFGLVPLPRIAESYLRRSLRQLDDTDDAATHEIVRIVVGYYHAGTGSWDEAREQFLAARRTANRISDRRRLQDAVGNLLEVDCLRGAFAGALELADELKVAALSRRDRRFEADALVARANALLQLGRSGEALREISAVREIMIEDPDLPAELKIKTEGLTGLVELANGHRDGAVAAADAAMRLTAGQRPTYFATFLGYAGPAEVYLDQWQAETGLQTGGSQFREQSTEALKRLQSYAGVFPIGRPRHALLSGRRDWLLGRHGAALASWRRAAELAAGLSMKFDLALAEYDVGRHLAPGDPDRDEHLRRATELFEAVGATASAAAARDALTSVATQGDL